MRTEPWRLQWCTIAPMPYFDDLFRRLAPYRRLALEVVYLQQGLKDYPMNDDLGRGYPHRSVGSLLDILKLYRDAMLRPELKWLVGGWGSPQYVGLLMILSFMGRRFWIFNDAPVPEGRTKSSAFRCLRGILLRYWFKHATGIIGTGRMAVDRLRDMGAADTKLCSLPYPLDESRFYTGRDYAPASGEPVVIVCSGRLNIRDKRFDLALQAFALLVASGCNGTQYRLRIAGAGPDGAALMAMAQRLGIADRVEFLGWLRQDLLAELYATGHVYLHPSDFEPYGVTVVEALYSGLYTVASDGVGAAVELVRDGVNGTVFPSGDVDRLAAALQQATAAVQAGRVNKATVRKASLLWKMDAYVETMLRVVGYAPASA